MSIKIDWYSSKLILSFQKDECKYSFGHVYHQSADRTKQIYRHFLWTSPFSHSSKVFVVILCIDVIDLIATMFLSRNLWFNWWNSTKSCTVYTSSGYHCVPFRIQLHWFTVSQPSEKRYRGNAITWKSICTMFCIVFREIWTIHILWVNIDLHWEVPNRCWIMDFLSISSSSQ